MEERKKIYCSRCKDYNDKLTKGTFKQCPFASEIHDTIEYCDCCSYHRQQCLEDI